MTNTSDLYWSVDGVSLQTLARNIETIGGLDTPPAMRGDDTVIPYRVGEVWNPKVPGSRVLPFGMWVRGTNDDGEVPTNRQDLYDDNWRQIRRLLFTPGRRFLLTKRFRVNGELHTASQYGEYNGGLEPTMRGRYASKFTANIKLADPYFRDDVVQHVSLASGNQNVTVAGDVETDDIVVTLGGRSNPKVRNATLGVEVEYHDVLLAGDIATIDIHNFSALTDPAATPTFVSSGKVRHTGAPEWLKMKNGLNVINLSSTSGAAPGSLDIRSLWL